MPYLEDLCARYIQYEIHTSIAWMVFLSAVVALAGLIWTISGIVSAKCVDNDIANCICYLSMFVFWAALVTGVIVSMVQVYDIIECHTIPEKVILEYLKTLMNNASNGYR